MRVHENGSESDSNDGTHRVFRRAVARFRLLGESSHPAVAWRGILALILVLVVAAPEPAAAQWRAEMLPGLRFGPPLKAGAAVGVAYGNRLARFPFAGPLALVEVGLGGARASVGYFFAGPFASGIELLGSGLRTWGEPSQLEPNQTLIGGELRLAFFLVNVGFTAFRPVAGFPDDDRRTRYYLNLGLGI
jgi:hypothetical protein